MSKTALTPANCQPSQAPASLRPWLPAAADDTSGVLLIDAGHSSLKWALYADGQWQEGVEYNWRQEPAHAWLAGLPNVQVVQSCYLCAPVPEAGQLVIQAQQRSNTVKTLSVTASTQLDLGSYPPEQLGVDRLAHVWGLWALVETGELPVKVGDTLGILSPGTALVADLVHIRRLTPTGLAFQGGWIAPGWGVFAQALSARTQLPRVQQPGAADATWQPGQHSQACVDRGHALFYGGGLKQLCQSAGQWVITGSDAEVIKNLPALEAVCWHEVPSLAWLGLLAFGRYGQTS